MKTLNIILRNAILVVMVANLFSCAPELVSNTKTLPIPKTFIGSSDTNTSATINWNEFFTDKNLVALIDTALANNQELNIILQEIAISKNEIRASKGEFLPFLNLRTDDGTEKVGRYTSQGANDANTEIMPGKEFPEPLSDFKIEASASWELDIWRKLRNGRDAAVKRYLATVDGKNFMVTHLVSEIAHSYYELLALDNRLKLLEQNISILENALKIVKLQKQAAKVTELAVKRFEAEMLDNQSRLYYVKQQIIETENKINYLVGRYPTTIIRSSDGFNKLLPQKVYSGIPAQLMQHRPDVRQAENLLAAAKLDVAIAKAEFYPSIKLTAGLGFQAFNPQYIVTTPESMLYSLAGELVAPVINRNAIKANYYSANSKQIQAIIEYQSTVLNAYVEVVNQLASINNLNESYNYKQKQVKVLNESITIASNLFKSARADYMEVLMTQRDALESKVELVETKRDQFMSMISLYEALGGGWN